MEKSIKNAQKIEELATSLAQKLGISKDVVKLVLGEFTPLVSWANTHELTNKKLPSKPIARQSFKGNVKRCYKDVSGEGYSIFVIKEN